MRKRRKQSDARAARGALLAAVAPQERIRHRAVRTCAGCGRRDLRDRLRRFVLVDGGAAGGATVDGERRLVWRASGGRGGYIHGGAGARAEHVESDREESLDPNCVRRFVAGKPTIVSLRARVEQSLRHALVESGVGI